MVRQRSQRRALSQAGADSDIAAEIEGARAAYSVRADEAVVDAAHLRSFGCRSCLEVRKGPIRKAGEAQSADDVVEVLVQKRCTGGLQDNVVHDCSLELSREPPWQMPHVPWAMELAGSHLERQRQ